MFHMPSYVLILAGVMVAGAAFAGPAFVWPLTGTTTPHKINSPFGPRLRASAGYIYEFHPGVDFQADVGTPVYAAATGTVRLLTDACSAFTGKTAMVTSAPVSRCVWTSCLKSMR